MPVCQPVTDVTNYYGNFEAEFRNFWTNGSYYCILAGLGLIPNFSPPALAYRSESVERAEALFAQVKEQQKELVSTLPSTYEYLRQIHAQ